MKSLRNVIVSEDLTYEEVGSVLASLDYSDPVQAVFEGKVFVILSCLND